MPWTAEYYPAATRNLPDPVRLKAITIANALLIKRMAEDQANRIADGRIGQVSLHNHSVIF